MKRFFYAFVLFCFPFMAICQGNSGLGFNYQAIVRGIDGFVLPKQNVELRFSLMPGQQATQASWVETHSITTDALGTIGVTIGKGTKAGGLAASFTDVNFAVVHYWLKVEINENGSYRELSYSALSSVPYAEAATNAISSPIGSVMPFAGDAGKIPDGWLLCDGSEISRSEYTSLYNVIGTTWGHGNNVTTFNLPDMRGMFLRGVSGFSEKDGDADARLPLKEGGNSGNIVGSYQGDAIRNITGTWTPPDDGGSQVSGFVNAGTATGAFYARHMTERAERLMSGDATNGGKYFVALDASLIVPVGNDNRPKNVYVNYIIKY